MMRDAFIQKAISTSDERGNQGPYWFNVMPKNNKPDEENPRKAAVTKALMHTIFANPEYRIFALKIYDILITKLTQNPFTRAHFHKNLVVLLKGGTAYTYVVKEDSTFPYSDLDIVININPFLPKDLFDTLKETVNTIVLQTISQYKRAMDFMFFSNKERMSPEQISKQSQEQFLADDVIEAFKRDFNRSLEDIADDEGSYISPFENNDFRNIVSRCSSIITDSVQQENSIVRVEVPHYRSCERIPLRKTPLFCSHNSTIRFNRLNDPKAGTLLGSFELYRLRFNSLFVFSDANDEGKFPRETVTADFVDISVANQDDAELREFWMHGRTGMVKDDITNIWIVIPDVSMMVNELYKMLHIYECPESKREKRQQRYDILSKILPEV